MRAHQAQIELHKSTVRKRLSYSRCNIFLLLAHCTAGRVRGGKVTSDKLQSEEQMSVHERIASDAFCKRIKSLMKLL